MKVTLEPVDSVTVTTLVDNYVDMLLTDQGPAKRPGPPARRDAAGARLRAGGGPDD